MTRRGWDSLREQTHSRLSILYTTGEIKAAKTGWSRRLEVGAVYAILQHERKEGKKEGGKSPSLPPFKRALNSELNM